MTLDQKALDAAWRAAFPHHPVEPNRMEDLTAGIEAYLAASRPSAIVEEPMATITELGEVMVSSPTAFKAMFDAMPEVPHGGIKSIEVYPSPQPHTGRAGPPLTIVYTNWRGETAERRIVPMYLWHGATEWHPEPQWLLKATDADKGEERDFAWNGIDFQGDGPANAALTVEPVAGEVK